MANLNETHIINNLTVDGDIVCNSLNESLQNIDTKKQNSFLNETPIEVTNCASLNENFGTWMVLVQAPRG